MPKKMKCKSHLFIGNRFFLLLLVVCCVCETTTTRPIRKYQPRRQAKRMESMRRISIFFLSLLSISCCRAGSGLGWLGKARSTDRPACVRLTLQSIIHQSFGHHSVAVTHLSMASKTPFHPSETVSSSSIESITHRTFPGLCCCCSRSRA